VGTLLDDGQEGSGDAAESDGTYSCKVPLSSAVEASLTYRARIIYDTGEGERTVFSNLVGFVFFEELTLERAQEIIDQVQGYQAQLELLAETLSAEEAAQQLLAEVEEDPAVTDSGLTGSGEGVWWFTAEGYPCLAAPLPGTASAAGSSLLTEPVARDGSEHRPGKDVSAPGDSRWVIGNHKVLYLHSDPDVISNDDRNALLGALRDSENPKFQVFEREATIDAYQAMGGHGIVYIDTIAVRMPTSPTRPEDIVMFTSEEATAQKLKDYAPMFEDSEGSKLVLYAVHFLVSPRFIRVYCGAFPRSVVYLGFQRSFENDTLAKELTAKGAGVIYGYGGPPVPGLGYFKWGNKLFDELLAGKTTGEAFDDVWANVLAPEGYFAIYGSPPYRDILISESEYRLIDLGTAGTHDPQYSAVQAMDVNTRGQVVGWCDSWEEERVGFLWEDGLITTLRRPEDNATEALAINDLGEIVGVYHYNMGLTHACYWYEDGALNDLDFAGHRSRAVDINNSGLIVGTADILVEEEFCTQPCVFTSPRIGDPNRTAIGRVSADPDDDYTGGGIAVNDRGWIIGWTSSSPPDSEVRDAGSASFMSTVEGEPRYLPYEWQYMGETEAVYAWPMEGLNNLGHIVGIDHPTVFSPPEHSHGSLYRFSTMESLLSDGQHEQLFDDWIPYSEDYVVHGMAINDAGVVVGQVPTTEVQRAFICFPGEDPRWLDELVPADLAAEWELHVATGISNNPSSRYVCGYGLHYDMQRGFLLVRRYPE
jgi:hypothetical protein